ncbi:MAG: glycosyltransferase family 39 protein [Candidatus Kerfeldbacteria bacterium]
MQDNHSQAARPSLGLLAVSLVAILALSLFVLFWRLGEKPLENWDEGIHAEVTREMYHQDAWFSLSYRDELYTAKPPLKFWMTALLFPLFGESEFTLRFWSAIAGVATALLITFWMWEISSSMRLAFLAGAIFTLGRFVLYHAFRTGETDGLLILLFTAALYAYWRSRESPGWFLGFGACIGLAVMTKSFAGLLPVIIVAIDLSLSRRWSRLGIRTVALSAGIAAAIALPWHILELVRHGATFWNSYFEFHILERSSEVLYENRVSWLWYAVVLFKRTYPFGVFIPLALLLSLRRILKSRDEFDRLLLVWITVVFIVFSFVKTKFDWYILPLYAPLVLVLARGFSEFLHQKSDRLLTAFAALSFFVGIYLLPQGLAHEGLLWRATPFAYVPEWFVLTVAGKLIVAAVVTGIVIGVTFLLRTQTIIEPTRAVGMAVIVYLVIIAFGWQYSYLKHLPTASPLKDIAERVSEVRAEKLDVVGIRLVTQPAGYYYLRRMPDLSIRELSNADEAQGPLILVASDSPQYDSVRNRGNAILERDRFVLFEVATMKQ